MPERHNEAADATTLREHDGSRGEIQPSSHCLAITRCTGVKRARDAPTMAAS